jgi:hypothetical protein
MMIWLLLPSTASGNFLDSLSYLFLFGYERFMNGMERTMKNVVVKDFIENLYQKCVTNGIKLPSDKMQATTELWNEAGGSTFDAEKSYDVRPLWFSFFFWTTDDSSLWLYVRSCLKSMGLITICLKESKKKRSVPSHVVNRIYQFNTPFSTCKGGI